MATEFDVDGYKVATSDLVDQYTAHDAKTGKIEKLFVAEIKSSDGSLVQIPMVESKKEKVKKEVTEGHQMKTNICQSSDSPVIVVPLSELKVKISSMNVVLKCKVKFEKNLNFNWFFNNVPTLEYKTKYDKKDETASLIIPKISQKHEGTFMLRISNNCGTTESECNVTVMVPPKFLNELISLNLFEENEAHYTTNFSGFPCPVVEWKHKGQTLQNSSKYIVQSDDTKQSSLTIKNLELSDNGNVSCTVINDVGQAVSKADLKVQKTPALKAPAFTKELENLKVPLGKDCEFLCKLVGTPKLNIEWFKNDEKICNPTFSFEKDTVKLTLKKVQMTDDGTYTCVASNSVGNCKTHSILSTFTKPEFVKKLSNNLIKQEEEVIELSVAIVGFPKPDITWLFNNIVIDTPFEHDLDTGTVKLLIGSLSLQHSGTYACQISNFAGDAKCVGKLTVKANEKAKEKAKGNPPVFESLLEKSYVFENDTEVRVECTLRGNPFPEVKWHLAQKDVKNSKVSVDKLTGTCGFIIPRFNIQHEGELTCTAKNKHGVAQSKCNLIVGGQPEIMELQTERFSPHDKTMIISFKAAGKPYPDFIVMRNNEQFSDGSGSDIIVSTNNDTVTMELKNLPFNDNDLYQLAAKNPLGKAVQMIQIENSKLCMIASEKSMEDSSKVSVTKSNETINESEAEKSHLSMLQTPGSTQIPSSENEKKQERPKIIKTLLRSIEVKEGEPITLTCKFKGEDISVVWQKENINIEDNEDMNIVTNITGNKGLSSLKIENTPPSFAGELACIISNPFGEVQTVTHITVLPGMPQLKGFKLMKPVAPSVWKHLKDIEDIQENQLVSLECIFKGSKPLSITWLRDGQVIQRNAGLSMTFQEEDGCAILKWENMPKEMEGIYTCRAENKLGFAETHCSVLFLKSE
jgi:hemicentin